MEVSLAKLNEYRDEALRAVKTAGRYREKAEAVTDGIVRTMEIGGASFTMGAIQGYRVEQTGQPLTLAGVPIELLTAGVGHLAGLTGIAGRASGHLHAIADGSLAAYLSAVGRGAGKEMAVKAGKPKTTVRGDDGGRAAIRGGGGTTDEEIAEQLRKRAPLPR